MLVNVFSLNYTYGALNFFFSGLHIYSSYRKWNLRAFSPAGMSQHHISEKQKNIEFPSNIALVRKKRCYFLQKHLLFMCFMINWKNFPFFYFQLITCLRPEISEQMIPTMLQCPVQVIGLELLHSLILAFLNKEVKDDEDISTTS